MSFDLLAWLRRSALPLWSDVGVDAETGLFVERLDLDGTPLRDVPRRVMVQARQIFVFAEAEARGWHPGGGALAERAAETMVRMFRRDDASWIFSVTADGRAVDETRDFYAHAFVIFALAHLTRLTGSKRWLDLADSTLAFLDAHLATAPTGSYAESLPANHGSRRQNPHMHLLEAVLALDEVAPGGRYRARAEAIIILFERHFLHGPRPVLVEYYDDELRPIEGRPLSFEPGHHFEWAWLLAWNAALAGRERAPDLAARLCDSAQRLGATAGGVFHDEVDSKGNVLVASNRLWPCTEALRATALRLVRDPPAPDCAAIAEAMHGRFLAPAAEGCWLDHQSPCGAPLSTYVPASSLYHIVGAASALAGLLRP